MLYWAAGITLGFAAVEAAGGIWSGSLALTGDAGHMFSDAAALGIAALAAWLSKRPPSATHSYGLGRVEVIAAIVNALLMLALVAGIFYAAIQRLGTPQPVAGGTVTLIALLGLGVNIGLAWVLARGEQTLNTRAAMLHVLGDLLGSVAALLAGAVVMTTGWTPIDPLLSLVICVLILISTLRLLRDSILVIMEGVPRHIPLAEVGAVMAATPNVQSVHDLHVWTLSSGNVALSAHIVIDSMQAWPEVLGALRTTLHERFDIQHTTLQPESPTHILQQMPLPERLKHR
jgi:cobalt-zinc-cadmium efflux system protein